MKMWMADLRGSVVVGRSTVIAFAPHETAARESIDKHCGDNRIEDIFEIELDDNRWNNLVIEGILKTPERF
jgi:hypothetical protein